MAAQATATPGTSPVALPSPLAPLTSQPPLAGGATATSETHLLHRVDATTRVRVSVDATGAAFGVVAVQRLVVHVPGDYVFTVGAPLASVAAAPGSQSAPGVRGAAILWEGFNPGTRVLAARAVLRRPALEVLPLGVVRRRGSVTLVNRTGARGIALAADARAAPLAAALRGLRDDVAARRTPRTISAQLTSTARTVRLEAAAPLRVTGTIGTRQVDIRLGGGLPMTKTVAVRGPIDLTVTPIAVVAEPPPGLNGRRLLAAANETLLSLARVSQYRSFLGNPDSTGRSATTYRYVSATRPVPVAEAAPSHGSTAVATVAWVAAAIVVAGAALVVWARS